MNRNPMNERQSPYMPKSLPVSMRLTPPTTLASRSGPYSLASGSIWDRQKQRLKDRE